MFNKSNITWNPNSQQGYIKCQKGNHKKRRSTLFTLWSCNIFWEWIGGLEPKQEDISRPHFGLLITFILSFNTGYKKSKNIKRVIVKKDGALCCNIFWEWIRGLEPKQGDIRSIFPHIHSDFYSHPFEAAIGALYLIMRRFRSARHPLFAFSH